MTAPLNPWFYQRRTAYLGRCMKISLARRWYWPVFAGSLAGAVASSVGLGQVAALGSALVAVVLVAALIALNSWQRHSGDFCVGRSRDLTSLLSADLRTR